MIKNTVFIVKANLPKKWEDKRRTTLYCLPIKLKSNKERIWCDYVAGKQTYEQLSERYNVSRRTVQRYIGYVSIDIPVYLPCTI